MTTMLDTAVLARLTAGEGTKHTLSATPVTSYVPSGTEYDATVGWFVTGAYHGSALLTAEDAAALPNTIRKVRCLGPASNPVFQTGTHLDSYVRVTGAPLNPPLQDGKYYAVLDESGGDEKFIIRYNDDDHRGDRHRAHLPFSIITGRGGTAWIHATDALTEHSADDLIYVEVEPPVTAGRPAVSEAAEEPVPDPAPEPVVEHVDGSLEGPTMGLVVTDAEGHVEVSPEPVEGGLYIHWDSRGVTNILAQYRGGEWKPMGYYNRHFSGGERTGDLQFLQSSSIALGEDTRWAPARLEAPATPELLNLEERKANLYRALEVETSKWDRLDEALTTLAKDKDWCSEFESFAEPLGFSPREHKKDWDVYVDVTFTATMESPSSYVDSRIGSEYDLPNLEISSMTVSGSMRVCVTVEDETEDYARDYIDSSVLYDAIDTSADITIDDYSIDRIDPA